MQEPYIDVNLSLFHVDWQIRRFSGAPVFIYVLFSKAKEERL